MHSSTGRNIWLIARREYLQHVKTKAFVIGTVLTPLLMAAMMLLPARLMMRSSGTKSMVLVTSRAEAGQAIQGQVESPRSASDPDDEAKPPREAPLKLTLSTDTSEANREELLRQVESKKLDGFIWATDEALKNKDVKYFSRETSDFMLSGTIRSAVTMGTLKERLSQRGFTAQETEDLSRGVRVEAMRVERGQASSSNFGALFIGSITMMMLLYIMVLMQGITVMRAVLEEKTSRVMEVLLSTCTSMELMAGKIIGVGAVGITQISIWAVSALLLMSPGLVAVKSMGGFELAPLTIAFFVVFYLLGYLTYSSIYAALGASCNSEQEAQSLQFLAMLPLILSTVFMMAVVRNPSSGLSVALSMFPLTAPLIMFLRISIQMPPMWQIAASIALLLAGIVGLMWLASRIYRIGILMYGKRPTLPEIVKWIRYA